MAVKRGFGRLGIMFAVLASFVFITSLIHFWMRQSDSSDYLDRTTYLVSSRAIQMKQEGSSAADIEAAKQAIRAERQEGAARREEDAALALYATIVSFVVTLLVYPFFWLIGWTAAGFSAKD